LNEHECQKKISGTTPRFTEFSIENHLTNKEQQAANMKTASILFLSIVLVVIISVIEYVQCVKPDDADPNIMELTPDNIQQAIQENNVLIEFYAPWCGHCQHFAPTYKKLADLIANSDRSGDIKIAKINASAHQSIVSSFSIRGFPTIKLFLKGKEKNPVDYTSDRSIQSLLDFLHKHLDE